MRTSQRNTQRGVYLEPEVLGLSKPIRPERPNATVDVTKLKCREIKVTVSLRALELLTVCRRVELMFFSLKRFPALLQTGPDV